MDLPGKGRYNRCCVWTGTGGDRNKRNRVGGGWRERELRETTGIGGNVETECSGNLSDSTRVTLDKTPRNGGYRTRTDHLLQQRTFSRTQIFN